MKTSKNYTAPSTTTFGSNGELLHTNVFTILDCNSMSLVNTSTTIGTCTHLDAMLFSTENEAEYFASNNLEIWTIVPLKFNHRFIQHQQNQTPEILSVEHGAPIDIESRHLHVKIRFGKWIMDFSWTLNTKSNWVHTNQDPTHLDGVEIDDDEWVRSADKIMESFDFDDDMIGVEIEKMELTFES